MVYWYAGPGWGGFLVMAISMVLWIVLIGFIVWGAYSLFTGRTTNTIAPASPPSALEVLRQRYARGEIDEPTFTHMRDTLQQPTPQS